MRTLPLLLVLACTGDPAPVRVPAPAPSAPIPLALVEPGSTTPPVLVSTSADAPPPLAIPERVDSTPTRCAQHGRLSPSAGEDGQWAGVRLVPPSTPFRVERVRLTLIEGSLGGVACDASRAHQVRLYVGSTDGEPPSGNGVDPKPAGAYSFFRNKEQPRGDRPLVAEVGGAITLQAGQALYAVVDTFHRDDGSRTCLKTCLEGPRGSTNFWSHHAEPAQWAWAVWRPARGAGIVASLEGFP